MIPLRDESRRAAGIPLATGAIIGINAVVFLLELARGDPFVAEWAATPADIASGHRLITLLSSMFLHASWSHILGNMIFLWAFGPQIEDAMGRVRFVGFYLAGGLAAMAAQVAADPSSTVPSLGASGAIAAVMGAYMLLYPGSRVRTLIWVLFLIRVVDVPAYAWLGLWFVLQLLSSTAPTHGNDQGGVAFFAHIGGFAFGALTVILLGLRRPPRRALV